MFDVSIITNHSAIHIKGQDYPNPIQKRGVDCNNPDDVIQCSIETRDCSGVINVESWDLRLEHGQELWFCELNETVKLTSDNNTGVHKNLNAYQSVTNRIIVTFKNNFSRDGGHFWLAFVPGTMGFSFIRFQSNKVNHGHITCFLYTRLTYILKIHTCMHHSRARVLQLRYIQCFIFEIVSIVDPVSSTLTVKCPVANASCPQYSSCHIFQERTCPPCGTNCIDDKNKGNEIILLQSIKSAAKIFNILK